MIFRLPLNTSKKFLCYHAKLKKTFSFTKVNILKQLLKRQFEKFEAVKLTVSLLQTQEKQCYIAC